MQEAKIRSRAMTMSVAFVLFVCGCGGGTSEPVAPGPMPAPGVVGKERTCPEAWINNVMPGPPPGPGALPNEYLVVGGQRRELTEFDVDWIKANCPVNKPTDAH